MSLRWSRTFFICQKIGRMSLWQNHFWCESHSPLRSHISFSHCVEYFAAYLRQLPTDKSHQSLDTSTSLIRWAPVAMDNSLGLYRPPYSELKIEICFIKSLDLWLGEWLTVVELWQKAVLLPHGMIIVNGLHRVRNIAQHTQHTRPVCVKWLEYGNRHLSFGHAHPNVPIVLIQIFIDCDFPLVEYLHQFGSIQHYWPFHQILVVRIDTSAYATINARPSAGLHIDMIAVQPNARFVPIKCVYCIECNFFVNWVARQTTQCTELNNKCANARSARNTEWHIEGRREEMKQKSIFIIAPSKNHFYSPRFIFWNTISQIDSSVRHSSLCIECWQQTFGLQQRQNWLWWHSSLQLCRLTHTTSSAIRSNGPLQGQPGSNFAPDLCCSKCAPKRPPTIRIFVSNTDTLMSESKFDFVSKMSTTRRNSVKFPITANVSSESINVNE